MIITISIILIIINVILIPEENVQATVLEKCRTMRSHTSTDSPDRQPQFDSRLLPQEGCVPVV